MAKSPWKLTEATAELAGDRISLTMEVTRPCDGISKVMIDGNSLNNCRLLAIDFPGATKPEPIAESYVRGTDLIVTYLQTPSRTIRPQLYWRANLDLPCLELQISAQTSLLASEPSLMVGSQLANGELFLFDGKEFSPVTESVDSGCSNMVVFRPNGAEISYVETIHPLDIENVRLVAESDSFSTHFTFFQHGLEKGVIRRGRMLSSFVPREDDQSSAVQLFEQFAQSEAPLTT